VKKENDMRRAKNCSWFGITKLCYWWLYVWHTRPGYSVIHAQRRRVGRQPYIVM